MGVSLARSPLGRRRRYRGGHRPTGSTTPARPKEPKTNNRTLKGIFTGAATTLLREFDHDPLAGHYNKMFADGVKPNPTKLTFARKIAAVIHVMRKETGGLCTQQNSGRAPSSFCNFTCARRRGMVLSPL